MAGRRVIVVMVAFKVTPSFKKKKQSSKYSVVQCIKVQCTFIKESNQDALSHTLEVDTAIINSDNNKPS